MPRSCAPRMRLCLGLSDGRGVGPRSPAAQTLTPREWSIASAAASRERNKEIAERLGLSLRTVENHLANVYRKLGVTGRDGLADVLG